MALPIPMGLALSHLSCHLTGKGNIEYQAPLLKFIDHIHTGLFFDFLFRSIDLYMYPLANTAPF